MIREGQLSTNLNSRRGVLQRLRRGRLVRARFVESHISKALAFQTRALREKEGWSQQTLAEKIGSNQNAVYRAENPNYGKQTITTLKKIAAAFDVALIVRFVPFSELTDWVSGTPRTIDGLTTEALTVPSFEAEERDGVFDQTPTPTANEGYNALNANREEWATHQQIRTSAQMGVQQFILPAGKTSNALEQPMLPQLDRVAFAAPTSIDTHRKWKGTSATEWDSDPALVARRA